MMHFSFYWSFRTLVVTALLRPLCCQIKNPCQLSLSYTIVSHFWCPRATAVALLDIALGSRMSHPRDPNCDRGIDHPLDHFGIVELIILVTHLGTRLIIHPPIWGSRHHSLRDYILITGSHNRHPFWDSRYLYWDDAWFLQRLIYFLFFYFCKLVLASSPNLSLFLCHFTKVFKQTLPWLKLHSTTPPPLVLNHYLVRPALMLLFWIGTEYDIALCGTTLSCEIGLCPSVIIQPSGWGWSPCILRAKWKHGRALVFWELLIDGDKVWGEDSANPTDMTMHYATLSASSL